MGIGVEGHDDTYWPGPIRRWIQRLNQRWTRFKNRWGFR